MSRLQRGQATIEAAIVLPILVLFVLFFGAVQIRIEAQSEMDAAVSLAVASAVIQPVYPSGSAYKDCSAQRTFSDTIKQYNYFSANTALTYLNGNGPSIAANVCPGIPAHTGCGPSIRGNPPTTVTPPTITCTGHAQLTGIVVSGLGFLSGLFSVAATSSAAASPYRTDCGVPTAQSPVPPC